VPQKRQTVKREGEQPKQLVRPLMQQSNERMRCIALLLKMASSSELLDYSSPVKRRKVDSNDQENINVGLMDVQSNSTSHDSSHDDLEGIRII